MSAGRSGICTLRGGDFGGFSMRPEDTVARDLGNARGIMGFGDIRDGALDNSMPIARGAVGGVFGFVFAGRATVSVTAASGSGEGLFSMDLASVEAKHARVRIERCFWFWTYSLERGRMTIFSRFASLRILSV